MKIFFPESLLHLDELLSGGLECFNITFRLYGALVSGYYLLAFECVLSGKSIVAARRT